MEDGALDASGRAAFPRRRGGDDDEALGARAFGASSEAPQALDATWGLSCTRESFGDRDLMTSRFAYNATVAAELDEAARAQEHGVSARRAVLDALAATLDANALRLARDDAAMAAARFDADTTRAKLEDRALKVSESEADAEFAARWLRKEAARFEREEVSKRAALAEGETAAEKMTQFLRAKETQIEALSRDAVRAHEAASQLHDASEAKLASLAALEASLFTDRAQANEVQRRLTENLDLLKCRAADVDARAHAVASSDEAQRERAAALQQRGGALAQAHEEIERRAADADTRIAAAEAQRLAALDAEKSAKAAQYRAEKQLEDVQLASCAADAKFSHDSASLDQAKQQVDAWRAAALHQVENGKAAAAAAAAQQQRELESARSALTAGEDALRRGQGDAAAQQQRCDDAEKRAAAELSKYERLIEALEHRDKKAADAAKLEVVISTLQAENRALAGKVDGQAAELSKLHRALAESGSDADAESQKLALREDDLAKQEALLAELRSSRRAALAAQQPWVVARDAVLRAGPLDDASAAAQWARSLARRISDEQAAAHDAVRHARDTLRTLGSGGEARWPLLPRMVRVALRAAISLGDRVRDALMDMQAVLVRAFLRDMARVENQEAAGNDALQFILSALRGVASQELARRRGVVGALRAAHYADEVSCEALRLIPQRAADSRTTLFALRQNKFDALRLRLPAAKARFAAATARWAAPEFRRFFLDLARKFNGDSAPNLDRAFDGSAAPGVLYAGAHAVELRFDDDGDDGRHVPRVACVFDDAEALLRFYELLDNDRRAACVGVSNGFSSSRDAATVSRRARSNDAGDYSGTFHVDDEFAAADAGDAAFNESPPHEVAIALDLHHQGVLCDVRLRLRLLERPQRHLGSLQFAASTRSHEELMLPLWKDCSHCDGLLARLHGAEPPGYDVHDARPQARALHAAARTRDHQHSVNRDARSSRDARSPARASGGDRRSTGDRRHSASAREAARHSRSATFSSSASSSKLVYRPTASHDWAAPPAWQTA
ncbi:hypothetical protein M885DRAFT_626637 [Pelagophyceae sp. CCMP2097]|nr:hypothetical protein M885DRAFT_626637 [Pelagophyceae sp. CCMP2097]